MELRQYTIVLVDLDLTVGSEIKKTRPCVIVSPNEMNKYLNTLVVAPMTTNLKKYPSRVLVNHNRKKGMVVLDQIRTVDKKRIIKVFDGLNKIEVQNCKKTIKEIFVD